MAFDLAWKKANQEKKNSELNKSEKLSLVLETLKEHPFLLESPVLANQVAQFRIRLLGLAD